jgi:hypothetical protein
MRRAFFQFRPDLFAPAGDFLASLAGSQFTYSVFDSHIQEPLAYARGTVPRP